MAANPKIQVDIVAKDDATDDLKQVEAKMAALEGETTTVHIDASTATGNIDKLGRSADSSKSVLANMVGNATQDLGALGGVAGSAGVAIGQMGEYMADARASGEGFGSILRNFATVAGPIAALSVAMAGVSNIMSAMAKGQAAIKAFNAKQVEQFTEAIKQSGKVLGNYNETLADTGEVLVNTGNKAAPAWSRILPGVSDIARSLGFLGKFGDEIEDILPLLNQAGISSEIWSGIVTAGTEDQVEQMDLLRGAIDAVNVSDDERHTIMQAAIEAQKNYNTALENTRIAQEFFVGTGPTDFGHAPAAGIAAIIDANRRDSAALQARYAANGTTNVFLPQHSPAVVVRDVGTYSVHNSDRSGP